MPNRYTLDHRSSQVRVRNGPNADHVFNRLSLLLGIFGNDRTVRPRETGCQILLLEPYSTNIMCSGYVITVNFL